MGMEARWRKRRNGNGDGERGEIERKIQGVDSEL
jgi:hypothetical protein